ncbi:MAG: tRNA pseudouridine(38-40) synthase TruA [Deltaproteobacteria bacterium]|nr:tRNA pseudouridine(38-40) synthase TruA [Deltaproteobacteria bacterium]
MNIRLLIEYDGTDFHGWQRQPELPTIQQAIETAVTTLSGEKVTVHGAGRTDSGVHAKGQVANFHTTSQIIPEKWASALNAKLPPSIRILESRSESESFHSRNHATSKVYEYYLLNRKHASALNRRVLHYPRKLDWEEIRKVLPLFVGEKDFRAFQGPNASVRSTIRRVIRFDLIQDCTVEGLYHFTIEANGFLKQMVRAIIGTVLEIGEHKMTAEEIPTIILSRKRELAGRTAPANGLYLALVKYDER